MHSCEMRFRHARYTVLCLHSHPCDVRRAAGRVRCERVENCMCGMKSEPSVRGGGSKRDGGDRERRVMRSCETGC